MAVAGRVRDPPVVPLHAAFDLAALRTGPAPRGGAHPRGRLRVAVVAALLSATLVLAVGSTGVLAASTVTPTCDAVNLRTGPSTGYTRKTSVNEGAKLTVVATVSGGSYSTTCITALSGNQWHRISAINGRSVSSLYGVTYLYGASKLFKTVVTATPAPTAAPTAAVATPGATPAATAAPTAGPTEAPGATPTAAPTTDPNATPDPGSPAPTDSPAPTVAPPPTPAPTAQPVVLPGSITFHGRGYGHGVGMSQWGAYGRAMEGQTAAQIVGHYYSGTTLGTVANSQIRVLVLGGFKATSSNPVQVYGRGGSWKLDGVAKTFPADARVRFWPVVSGSTTSWRVLVSASDGTTLHSATTSNSVRVRPNSGSTTLQLWSKPSAYDRYRGVLRLFGKMDGSLSVNVIDEIPLESYLRGVVPVEVSASWPVEAVKAQAIAARSFAERQRKPGTGTFDLYDDTRHQVYRGILGEKAGGDAAVSGTAGQVVRTSSGAIANTLYHSAAGGWTENNEDAFVSSTGARITAVYSYLRGVSDRRADGTAYDEASPFDTWKTKTYTLSQLQAWFAADSRTNVGTLVALDLRNRGVSGRLISVTLIGANGTKKTVSGEVFRAIFNAKRPSGDPMMRSSLFDVIPVP
jgi:SpoIID/LytB domain protein